MEEIFKEVWESALKRALRRTALSPGEPPDFSWRAS